MLLCYAGARRSPALLDFLAPSLISRRNSTSLFQSRKPNARQSEPSQALGHFPLESGDPSALLGKVQHRITLLDSTAMPGGSSSDAEAFNQTINNLRGALRKNDAHAVRKHWTHLRNRNLLRLMGPPQLEGCSRLIAASSLAMNSQLWEVETRHVIEEIAIVAAAGGATEALNAILMIHIKGNSPDFVLGLYERYLESLDGKEEWAKVEDVEKNGFSLASSFGEQHTPSVIGVVRLLLAGITAHAMQECFEGALHTFLRNPQQLNTHTLKQFLKHLDAFPALQRRVEDYSRYLETARKVSQPSAFVKRISTLSKNPFHLERLYDSVIDGLTGHEAYIAGTPDELCYKKPVLMPEAGWISFLGAFVKCRRLDLAGKLWDDMIRLNITPTVSVWAALFNGYDTIHAIEETLIGWESMISQGIKPDTSVYRALISTLFNGHKPDDALERFELFKKERARRAATPEAFSEADVLIVYNTVLHRLLWHSRRVDANTLLRRMMSDGPTPDLVTFNTLLRYHGRQGNMQGISTILKGMGEANIVPDIFTFSTILTALLKSGREDAPELVISQMRKQGIEPNVQTYSAIIDQQVREGDERSIKAALRMLDRMEQEPHTRPNQVTYTTILAAIHRGGWSDRNAAEDCRRHLIAQMTARGSQFDRTTYNILLVACLQNREPDGLQYALKYYTEMVERNMPISNETWYIILHGLVEREEWDIADEMVVEMAKGDVEPRGALKRLVQMVRSRTRKKSPSLPGAYF
jgi:pentatricopeptide repeat protein